MKIKYLLFLAAFSITTSVHADEYECKVYCESSSGPTTNITVNADSASEAANIVDQQGHQVCQGAGYDNASSKTMDASQCSRK